MTSQNELNKKIEKSKKDIERKKGQYNRAVQLKRQSRFRFFEDIRILNSRILAFQEAQELQRRQVKELKKGKEMSEWCNKWIQKKMTARTIGELKGIFDEIFKENNNQQSATETHVVNDRNKFADALWGEGVVR
jgi:hypothetical protein